MQHKPWQHLVFCVISIVVLFSGTGHTEEYADSATCVDCHADLCKHWAGSDHAKSMDHATEKTVLGDFSKRDFLHIGFDDLLLLNDGEIKTLLDQLESFPHREDPRRTYFFPNIKTESASTDSLEQNADSMPRYNVLGRKFRIPTTPHFDDLALAALDAREDTIKKLRESMSDLQRQNFDAELDFRRKLRFHRPGDIAVAQDRIDSVLRVLVADGLIAPTADRPIGTRFKMYRDHDGPDAKFMVQSDIGVHEVRFVLGVRPLQQYLVELDRGRVQTLPIAWDAVDKRWFHLYPKEQIPQGDPLHWTAPLQNWNRMCADCHTTNLQKDFDLDTKTYHTTFTEINVGCQACHGPCAEHDRIARKHDFKTKWSAPNVPKAVFQLSEIDEATVVNSCAFCHTRRRLLRPGPKPPETHASDWFVPETIDSSVYYPDGQLLEEAFEYGSFLQSKMHSKGVGCTNCHDAHSLELKFQGNRLCTQCHSRSIYDTPAHHFHPDGTKPGTGCVECHFPQSTYMVVDPRRDHSIRKPDPALSIATGVPNACTICHDDRRKGETLQWSMDWVERWYAEKRKSIVGYSNSARYEATMQTLPGPVADPYRALTRYLQTHHYSAAISAGRQGDPSSNPLLQTVFLDRTDRDFRPSVRAGALTLLGRLPNTDIRADLFLPALKDPDPWVRLAAVDAMSQLSDELKLEHLPKILRDSALAVRTEAVRVLAPIHERLGPGESAANFEKARAEYVRAQLTDNDQAAAYLNLAVLEHDLAAAKIAQVHRWLQGSLGELQSNDPAALQAITTAGNLLARLTKKALEHYRQSIELDPDFMPSRINLAMLYHELGDNQAAEKEFREAGRIEPDNPHTAYSLALLLAETGQSLQAVESFQKSVRNFERLVPRQFATEHRVRYNLGLLLFQQERFAEAEKELETIVRAEPENTAFLYALTTFYMQRNEKEKASKLLDRLIRLEPNNVQWTRLKAEIERR